MKRSYRSLAGSKDKLLKLLLSVVPEENKDLYDNFPVDEFESQRAYQQGWNDCRNTALRNIQKVLGHEGGEVEYE